LLLEIQDQGSVRLAGRGKLRIGAETEVYRESAPASNQ